MDTNNGADKLIASIIEDAEHEAQALSDKADEEVRAVREKLDADRERLKDEFAERAQAERADTIKRAATNAELDGRKELLSRKRALIDEAYKRAYEELCALTGARREAVLKKLISCEAEGSETVFSSVSDRESLASLLKNTGLKLGGTEPSIDGGFILVGENYVKDCSFKALMEDVKARTLEKVAAVLFD